MEQEGKEDAGRRRFLKSAGALGAAAIPVAAEAQHAAHGAAKGEKYMFVSAAEVAFLDAAVARLIPADTLGPGAKEAGVTYFIDQQLFGGWGGMAKMYLAPSGSYEAAESICWRCSPETSCSGSGEVLRFGLWTWIT